MKKEVRQKRHSLRKKFWLILAIALILWSGVFFLVYFTDPFSFGKIPLFFIILLLATYFTSSLLTESTRRGLTVSISLTLFLLLRYFGIGNVINLLLIAGLALSFEYYFAKK